MADRGDAQRRGCLGAGLAARPGRPLEPQQTISRNAEGDGDARQAQPGGAPDEGRAGFASPLLPDAAILVAVSPDGTPQPVPRSPAMRNAASRPCGQRTVPRREGPPGWPQGRPAWRMAMSYCVCL